MMVKKNHAYHIDATLISIQNGVQLREKMVNDKIQWIKVLKKKHKEIINIKCYIKQLYTDPTYPTYPTYADISYYISQKFNKYINDDTLRHYF